MKKIVMLLLTVLLFLSATACGGGQGGSEEPVGGGGQGGSEEPVGGGLQTEAIIFDFANGSPEENIRRETHYSYSDITDEEMADMLSAMSGLDFYVTFPVGEDRFVVDWSVDSTLIAGLDDREQKEGFHFYDADSLRWFMMDSLWQTLKEFYLTEEIYYTMDGGKELVFDELYPVNVFPADLPYMGSAFYFAHSDVVGDFSYIDEEYSLILHYPNAFAPDGEPDETGGNSMRFPSREDHSVLRYWVIPNTYGDTTDSFAENAPADGISIYNNAVIGWGADLNQLTGEETPTAYYWVVAQDWIACVAISCETQEDAVLWCDRMIDGDAVSIGRLESEPGEAGISEDEAMHRLTGLLDIAEGTAVVSYGEKMVDGVHCWVFAHGKSTPEKFTAEAHYAVTDDGKILIYDFTNNEYKEFNAP